MVWIFVNEALEGTEGYEPTPVEQGFVRVDLGPNQPPVDLFVYGRRVGAAYGDLDAPPEGGRWPSNSGDFTFRVQRFENGQWKGNPRFLRGPLDHGTQVSSHWGPLTSEFPAYADKWRSWLQRGVDKIPGQVLFEGWRLPPDIEQTESTGSGRLFTMRCPAALCVASNASLFQGEAESMQRFSRDQDQRGYHYYHSERDYAPWIADGIHYCGRGYRTAGGGFRDLFSSPYPEHYTPGRKGWMVPHATHLTVQSEIATAYLLNDYMALRSAIHSVQAAASHFLAGERMSVRSYGRWFTSVAELAPAIASNTPGTENMEELVLYIISRLKNENRGGCPTPDNGRTSEGSHHLTNADVTEWCAGLNPPVTDPDVIQELARSDCLWQTTQLIYGLTAVIDLFTMYGLKLPQEVMDQRDFAVNFIGMGSRASVSIDLPQDRGPVVPVVGYVDELSATPSVNALRLSEGGTKMSSLHNGVVPRFFMPVLAMIGALYDPEFWKRGLPAYNYMIANGTWNGSYESWAMENAEALLYLDWEGSNNDATE